MPNCGNFVRMPLVYEKVVEGRYRLALWKVEESFEDLKGKIPLSKEQEERYQSIKLNKRKTEWIGRQFLFHYMDIGSLSYEATGKPVLDEGYISISHCDNLVTILLANYPVGIDLQNPQPIIQRIGKKFSNNYELNWIQEMKDPLLGYTLVWSIKEAIFKVHGSELPFADGMKVSLCSDLATARCEVDTHQYRQDFDLEIFRYEDYFLVFNV